MENSHSFAAFGTALSVSFIIIIIIIIIIFENFAWYSRIIGAFGECHI